MADTKPSEGSARGSGKRRGNPATLKPFPKGVSGNPGGMSKKAREQLTVRKWFDEHPDEVLTFIEAGIKFGKDGQAAYWQQIADRLWGKVKDVIEVQGGAIELHWPHQFTQKADDAGD